MDEQLEITSDPSGVLTVQENSADRLTTVEVTGAGGPVRFGFVPGYDEALFTPDETTGDLFFTTPPDYENPADGGHDNVYTVIVEASDGADSDIHTLEVTVTNENDNGPVITPEQEYQVQKIRIGSRKCRLLTLTAIS
jgi:hypothetical protein